MVIGMYGVDLDAFDISVVGKVTLIEQGIIEFEESKMDKARKTFTEKVRKQFIGEEMKPKRTGGVNARGLASSRPAANRLAIHSKWMTMFDNSKGVMLTQVISDDVEPVVWGQVLKPSNSILEQILDR